MLPTAQADVVARVLAIFRKKIILLFFKFFLHFRNCEFLFFYFLNFYFFLIVLPFPGCRENNEGTRPKQPLGGLKSLLMLEALKESELKRITENKEDGVCVFSEGVGILGSTTLDLLS